MWTLGEFNTLDATALTGGLMACCASPQWAAKVVSGRPYGSLAALRASAAAIFDELDAAELAVAHAAHPRIGEPIRGHSGEPIQGRSGGPIQGHSGEPIQGRSGGSPAPKTGQGLETSWSRGEQSRARSADATVQAALLEANLAYEHKFGQVFLICATGLGGEEVLAEARRRLDNDYETESVEARAQLRKIVLLRLDKAVTA